MQMRAMFVIYERASAPSILERTRGQLREEYITSTENLIRE